MNRNLDQIIHYTMIRVFKYFITLVWIFGWIRTLNAIQVEIVSNGFINYCSLGVDFRSG